MTETYITEQMNASFLREGKGIDRTIFDRIFLDGVKTGIAYMFGKADEISDELRKK